MAVTVIGIMLVRNEDRFVERAIRNAIDFCDQFIVCDHGSTDGTASILRELQIEMGGKLEVRRIQRTRESHEVIEPYIGREKTWIFGVDGDEIYDRAGLKRFRARLESGEFDNAWVVFGNVLNVRSLREDGIAEGYLAPPCRSMTKLYNFSAIESWVGRDIVERLHGGRIMFREGFGERSRLELQHSTPWDDSDYRCLHMCFLRRSACDQDETGVRENIMDRHAWSLRKMAARFGRLFGRADATNWKMEKYCRGEIVSREVGEFLNP